MSKSLLQKLGIKEGNHIFLYNQPDNYFELLQEALPEDVQLMLNEPKFPVHFIHFFTNSIAELESNLPKFQEMIHQNGMIWVSWYKKSSKLSSELNEDIIRDTALALKLVDVKVCSVSEIWSALKLVIRVNLRK